MFVWGQGISVSSGFRTTNKYSTYHNLARINTYIKTQVAPSGVSSWRVLNYIKSFILILSM